MSEDLAASAAAIIRDAVATATEPTAFDPSIDDPHVVVRVMPEGFSLRQVDLDAEHLRETPRRKRGTTVVRDAASFISLWSKHRASDSDIHADIDTATVTAVLNPHGVVVPGWGDHRISLRLAVSPEWERWTGIDGNLLSQQAFAEHIEDSLLDIREPDGATMLEIAQSFEAAKSVEFESGERLASGQRRFTYKETVAAKAGQRGTLDVPSEFTLAIAPWANADRWKVTARLRYRIDSSGLRIGVKLDRLDDVRREAFEAVVAGLAEHTASPILLGPAPTPLKS